MATWKSLEKDGYPGTDVLVLVTDGFDYSIGYYHRKHEMWFLDYSVGLDVKYWLEIPEVSPTLCTKPEGLTEVDTDE